MQVTVDPTLNLDNAKRLHFAGIGGIGMSGLARYFHQRGLIVTGYDRTETPLTQSLVADGIRIAYEPNIESVHGVDAVIYTPAVGEDFLELVEARRLGIRCVKRAAVLGAITRQQRTLGVAGTHGKTTTSSLATVLLRGAGIDCTAFVGGIMANYDTNYLLGKDDLVVVEADEFDRSFLQLSPQLAILTSIDPDHLDIYHTPEAVREAYHQFLERVPEGGTVIVNNRLRPFADDLKGVNIYYYGIGGEGAAPPDEFVLTNFQQSGLRQQFDLTGPGIAWKGLELPFPGRHNAENACAALVAAHLLGAQEEPLRQALAGFRGVRRRFEVRLELPEVTFIDDYAHHPAELAAAISTARRHFPDRKLIACFQPHLFTRTRDFAEGFGQSLSLADTVLLMHIYPARELSIPHVTSELIYPHIKGADVHIVNLKDLPKSLLEHLDRPSVVLTLGAGDIDTQLSTIEKVLLTKYPPQG
jgi:UDP-N-acetylmuramate--alanine ligase